MVEDLVNFAWEGLKWNTNVAEGFHIGLVFCIYLRWAGNVVQEIS